MVIIEDRKVVKENSNKKIFCKIKTDEKKGICHG